MIPTIKLFLMLSFFTLHIFFNGSSFAQSVLNCDVDVTSFESKYVPLLGFEGFKTVSVTLTVYQDNRIQVSGLKHVDAVYPPTRVTDSGIEFSGLLKFSEPSVKNYYGEKVVAGFLNRYNGTFDIYTPPSNMGFITFSGKGRCIKANKLF